MSLSSYATDGGAILLVLGILCLIFGAMTCIDSQSYIDKCEDHEFAFDHWGGCRLAEQRYIDGLKLTAIGIVLLISGAVLIAVGQLKSTPQK